MRGHPPRPLGAAWAGAAVLIGFLGTWACWAYFVQTVEGQRLDGAVLRAAQLGRTTLWRAAEPILEIVSVPFVVAVLVTAALIAALRRRWLLALQVTLLVGGANLTTQVLKHFAFDRPHLDAESGPGWNSLPSGHTTVAASVSAALLLVVPRGARPIVAVLAAGYTTLTGVSTLIGGWHRPSDVLAAIAVTLAWTGLATLLTAVAAPESPAPTPSGGTAIATGLLGLAGLGSATAATVALLRTRERLAEGPLTSRSDLATAYAGATLAVLAAAALAFAVILLAHQSASEVRHSRQPSSA